jgi:hypothetical protein
VTGFLVNPLSDEPDVIENKQPDQNCGRKGRQPGRYARDEEEAEDDFKQRDNDVNIVAQPEQNCLFPYDQKDRVCVGLDGEFAETGDQENQTQYYSGCNTYEY